ncbi:MAG: hypothetical protein V1821_01350, partial [bacterium]
DEYRKRIKEALENRESLEAHRVKFNSLRLKFPVEYANIQNATNSTGDFLHHATNVRNTFECYEIENLGDCYRAFRFKDCYRVNNTINSVGVESGMVHNSSNCLGDLFCQDSMNVAYSYTCNDCMDVFGSSGLMKKKNCILNKQYSEEEYKKLRVQIVADMKVRGEWGEFLPSKFCPHAYNDSQAMYTLPLTKDEALKRGYRWQDEASGTRGKKTIAIEAVPNMIQETTDSITKEILACQRCGLNYRVNPIELKLLRSLNLAVPLTCPECRFEARFKLHNKPMLYDRECMCDKPHSDHAGGRCSNKFKTTYAPNRPEIVYCGKCYQEEII